MDIRTGRGEDMGRRVFIPLSYTDDVNSVRVGNSGPMDEVLQETATE